MEVWHVALQQIYILINFSSQEEKEEDFGTGFCAPTQRHLWNLFENPHHSKAAKVLWVTQQTSLKCHIHCSGCGHCLLFICGCVDALSHFLDSSIVPTKRRIRKDISWAHCINCLLIFTKKSFRGGILFWGSWSSFCWLVLFRICHQIRSSTP